MVGIQSVILAVLTAVSGFCVYVHDADHASDLNSEHPFLALGHFQAVLVEDGVVVVLLLAVAIAQPFVSRQRPLRKARATALFVAAIILLVAFFSEVGVLCSEDQQLLSPAGSVARVFEVLLSGGAAFWSFVLGAVLLSTTENDPWL